MLTPEACQFENTFKVGSYQVHPDGKISLTSLADLFQEIAWQHADASGFGRNLAEAQQAWILSRFDIRCIKLPAWGDLVHVHTAGQGVDKLFAFRGFLLTDPTGNPLAHAISSWVLMHTGTKKLSRPEAILPRALFDPNLKPDWQPEKIRIKGEEIKREKLSVRYSDLDLNKHVNNTSYIRWIENILKENAVEANRFLINYQAECHLGDELHISLYRDHGNFIVQGTAAGRQVFLASAGSSTG